MTDNNDDWSQKSKEWEELLATGMPIFTFLIDEPLEVAVTAAGAMELTFVYGKIGDFETAAMAKAVLSPEVARRLKATFPNVENIPDTPPPKRDPRSSN